MRLQGLRLSSFSTSAPEEPLARVARDFNLELLACKACPESLTSLFTPVESLPLQKLASARQISFFLPSKLPLHVFAIDCDLSKKNYVSNSPAPEGNALWIKSCFILSRIFPQWVPHKLAWIDDWQQCVCFFPSQRNVFVTKPVGGGARPSCFACWAISWRASWLKPCLPFFLGEIICKPPALSDLLLSSVPSSNQFYLGLFHHKAAKHY